MLFLRHPPHDLREVAGNSSQKEECCLYVVLRQQAQNEVHIGFDFTVLTPAVEVFGMDGKRLQVGFGKAFHIDGKAIHHSLRIGTQAISDGQEDHLNERIRCSSSIGHDFLIANDFSDSQKKPEVGQAKRERVAKKSCWAPPAHALPTNNRAAIKYDLSDAQPDSLVAQRQRRINDEDKQQKQRSEPAQQFVRNQAQGGCGESKRIQQRG